MENLTSISRRGLLKGGGAIIVGFVVGGMLPRRGEAQGPQVPGSLDLSPG
jgi:hypothetical protein